MNGSITKVRCVLCGKKVVWLTDKINHLDDEHPEVFEDLVNSCFRKQSRKEAEKND